jgi:hypothetical protein
MNILANIAQSIGTTTAKKVPRRKQVVQEMHMPETKLVNCLVKKIMELKWEYTDLAMNAHYMIMKYMVDLISRNARFKIIL